MTAVLFLVQRISAMVLGLAVAVHLVTILYAIHGGLTAGEILARTHHNLGFALFYGLFVVAVATHAPIGLRNVIREWTPWRGRTPDAALVLFSAALLVLGLRAVIAVCVA
jgi:fumarate reductase subunit C